MQVDSDTKLASASWIWNGKTSSTADVYMCFRRRFEIVRPRRDAFIDLSADSDFVAWLNGVEIGRGQFSDFASHKTYGRFPLGKTLRKGSNVLAVLVYHRGEDFFDHQAGNPGLIASLESGPESIQSGKEWRGAQHSAFRSGHRERMTPQCGFTFQFDAQGETDWTVSAYDDHRWRPVRSAQRHGTGNQQTELSLRPLPALDVGKLKQGLIVVQGSIFRASKLTSAAARIAASALRAEVPSSVFFDETKNPEDYVGPPHNPARFLFEGSPRPLRLRTAPVGAQGRFFILDLGEETVGLLEFTVRASAGTVLEIAHGEHLDDGRVRAQIGGRNFADRYICDGKQRTFQMPFRRLGARYLEVHVLGHKEAEFFALGLRPVEYPTLRKGSFRSSDRMRNRWYDVAVRTLELCRHEHYEDCPWREQSLYAYDCRLQALFGYHAFGDYDFAAVSLGLLGESLDPQTGRVALTAPGSSPVNIPIFSFTWIVAVAEHWLYSGDPVLFEKYRDAMDLVLEKALTRRDEVTGLFRPPEESGCWHFYEWTPGLCGSLQNEKLKGAHHAAYNLHLLEALRSQAWMLLHSGEARAARPWNRLVATLQKSIHRAFWDTHEGIYRSELLPNGQKCGAHQLIQALALCTGVVPRNARSRAFAALTRSSLVPCTLSAAYYLFRAAIEGPATCRNKTRQNLSASWEKMILSGATSLWETAAGGADFDYAGSLCHGWSALPVYDCHAAVLGVAPLSPGFERFTLRVMVSRQARAQGKIPTPHGLLFVQRTDTPEGLCLVVKGPRRCVPELIVLPETRLRCATYNGSSLL